MPWVARRISACSESGVDSLRYEDQPHTGESELFEDAKRIRQFATEPSNTAIQQQARLTYYFA
jgi:hypothetical protein